MKKYYLIISLLFISFQILTAQVEWVTASQQMLPVAARSGGNTFSQDMALDSDGDIFITGEFTNMTSFDTISLVRMDEGPVFLAKYNSQGKAMWALGVDGSSNNKGHCVAVDDSNHIYFAGEYVHTNSNTILNFGNISLMGNASPSTFLAKVGDDGVPIWAIRILATDAPSSQHVRPRDMLIDAGGNILLFGDMVEAVNIEGQMYNSNNGDEQMMFLAKFRADGSLIWFRHTDAHGQILSVDAVSMEMDASGSIFLHGKCANKIYYGQDSLIAPGVGGDPYFLMKVDDMGDLQWWTMARANAISQHPHSFGLDSQGNSYLTLRTGGALHFPDTSFFPADLKGRYLLVKYNAMGQRQFIREIASGEFPASGGISDLNMNMVTQPDGKTFITGTYGGFGNYMVFGGRDTLAMPDLSIEGFRQFIAAYDAAGHYLDVGFVIDEYLSQPDMDWLCKDMLVDNEGKLILTGHYWGSLKIGNDSLYSFNQQDEMYLMKLDPQTFFDLNTSIEKSHFSPLQIACYPNPCTDYLCIRWKDRQAFEALHISLFNFNGQQILQTEMRSEYLQWQIGQLPAGSYVLLMQAAGKHWAGKVTIR